MEEKFDKIIIIPVVVILIILIIQSYINTSSVPKNMKSNYYYRINEKEKIEVIKFDEHKFNYYMLESGNPIKEYETCEEYSYNKKQETIYLKCPIGFNYPKNLKIEFIEENYIVLNIEGNNHKFYRTKEDAIQNSILNDNA